MIVFMLGGKIETCSMGGTTFRLSQSSCRPEGDQKRSNHRNKFYRYFLCRTSVVQQPSISVQNSNFAYASLLRNLVLHCDFPVVSPPPWKIHNTRYPYRSSCVDEGKGLSRDSFHTSWLGGNYVVSDMVTPISYLYQYL